MPATATDAHALPREIMIRPRALASIRHDTFAICGQDCVDQPASLHNSSCSSCELSHPQTGVPDDSYFLELPSVLKLSVIDLAVTILLA